MLRTVYRHGGRGQENLPGHGDRHGRGCGRGGEVAAAAQPLRQHCHHLAVGQRWPRALAGTRGRQRQQLASQVKSF